MTLFRDLDAIENLFWDSVDGRRQNTRAAARWPEAFRRFGIVLGETSPWEAKQLVTNSPIRDRILSALTFWLVWGRDATLAAMLHEIDPDLYRETVRAAVQGNDRDRLVALVNSPDTGQQPPWFVAILGRLDTVPIDQRKQLLRAALLTHPNDLSLIMTLCELNEEDFAERELWSRVAVGIRPDKALAWAYLGLSLGKKGDNEGAEACFHKAVRLDPAFVSVRLNLGVALMLLHRYEPAIREFRDAIRLDPDYALAHYNLGKCLFDQRDYNGAEKALSEAVRCAPKLKVAYNELGRTLAHLGKWREALQAARKTVELSPEDPLAHYNLATCLMRNGDVPGSLAAVQKAMALDREFKVAGGLIGKFPNNVRNHYLPVPPSLAPPPREVKR